VNNKFCVITELLSTERVKGIAGEHLYERLSAALEQCYLSQNKLFSVTTDGAPSFNRYNPRPFDKGARFIA
jgi:hypothetical protein